MTQINIYEVKTHFSRYLKRIRKGERILVCHRNHPVAELRPVRQARTTPRPVGLAAGTFQIAPAFFKPLPKSVLKAFQGHHA